MRPPAQMHAEEAPPGDAAARAQQVLRQSRYNALRHLRCDEAGGTVRISGRVTSHYLKQVALAAVAETVGAQPIVNDVKVGPAPRDEDDALRCGWHRPHLT